MKRLGLVIVLAAVAAALGCSRPSEPEQENKPAAATATSAASQAGTKQTWIYFTKNHGKDEGSPYRTDCVAIVGTERIGAQRGNTIVWHIRVDNGQNDDDKCDMLDVSKVNLRFKTDVMTKAVMKKLTPTGMVIVGTVSKDPMDIGAILDHHYQVFIDEEAAGPDPVVVVGCSSCGEPPEQ